MFQSTLLKHAGEVFFVLRNADLSSEMPRNSLEEKFCSLRVYNDGGLLYFRFRKQLLHIVIQFSQF